MIIGKKDYKVKFSLLNLGGAFKFNPYFCKHRQKKDFSFWLDVNAFFMSLFFQRDEATWYTMHISFFGLAVPEHGNVALLGFERSHSWEDLGLLQSEYEFEDHHLCDLIESSRKTYSINFLWIFDVAFSVSTYFDFGDDAE